MTDITNHLDVSHPQRATADHPVRDLLFLLLILIVCAFFLGPIMGVMLKDPLKYRSTGL